MSSGYGSASLTERIYAWQGDDDRAPAAGVRETAEMCAGLLVGAQIWTPGKPADDTYAIRYVKPISVDDREALITSANFSKAAGRAQPRVRFAQHRHGDRHRPAEQLDLLHQHGVLVHL